MKAEDPTWEQPANSQEGGAYPQELCPLRQFCYQEAPGPWEALAQLRALCHRWLPPETHSKEQILELLVLEQFLTILPNELRARIQRCPLRSGDEAATLLATLASQHGDPDPGQQATFYGQEQDMHLVVAEYPGASLEYQSLQFLQPGVSSLTCDPPQLPQESERWVPAEQDTSEEVVQGGKNSRTPNRDCARHIPGPTTFPIERTVSNLNSLRNCYPPRDSWARMYKSLQYAVGDISREGRGKDKSRLSELLQGLAFSYDSETEDSEPDLLLERKKLKASRGPAKGWTKRDIRSTFPSWSALDSWPLNLKSEKLNPVELFELFFDDETFNLIVNETNNYASQKNVNLQVTVQEMAACVWCPALERIRKASQEGDVAGSV